MTRRARRAGGVVHAYATVLLLLGGLWAVEACLDEGSGNPLGERCDDDGSCGEGTCIYGRCRARCTFDRECGEGQACVAVDGDPEQRVCTAGDEGAGGAEGGCPEPLLRGEDGICREPCGDCGTGRTCSDGVCVETAAGDGDGDADADADGGADADGDADADQDTTPWVQCGLELLCGSEQHCCFDQRTGTRACQSTCLGIIVECDSDEDCELEHTCCLSERRLRCVPAGTRCELGSCLLASECNGSHPRCCLLDEIGLCAVVCGW